MKRVGEIIAGKVQRQATRPGGEASHPEPACQVCRDAGVVYPRKEDGRPDYSRVVPCKCIEGQINKERAERLLSSCQLPARTEGKTFEKFENRDKKCEKAKAVALRMAQGDESVIFLTLMSATGRGKSHLVIAICREWLKRGEAARYAYVPELLDDIRASYRMDEATGQSYSQLLDRIGTIPLLVLDDLGTEKKGDFACEKLQTIIDRRARSALPLVVTTNKPLDGLPNDDEGRIASRLQRESWCKVVIL